MTDESGQTAAKKPGPKSRAQIESEMREQIEAETRAKVEAELRESVTAELRAEAEAKAQKDAIIREAAAEARPIDGASVSADPSEEGSVTINFVEDGLTILGKVWYRGEVLTLAPGTKNWDEAMVNLYKGSSERIMFAHMDEDQQIRKWGRRFFRPGIWRGVPLDQIEDENLSAVEKAQLVKAQRLHEERYGAVV